MIYKIVSIADIHWGAMDPVEMYEHLQYLLAFIRQKKDLDLVVLVGDYFDYRLTLNSKAALLSLRFFDELYNTCKESGVQRLRMIKGTQEHDNDQLDAIHPKEDGDFFKKFYTNTVEETLPGLRCIYCPDEDIFLEDYLKIYAENIRENIDIGFFHGNFDVILPKFVLEENLNHHTESIIFEKKFWAMRINGPMIAGHWHTETEDEPLHYIGSYDRWKFGEEEDKGFLYTEYNTDTQEYFHHHIKNPYARRYETLVVDNSLVSTPEQFAELRDTVKKLHNADPLMKIKIKYLISEENLTAMQNFNEFRNVVSNIKGVKIDFKDLSKREKKKKEKETNQMNFERYSYISRKTPVNEVIQRYLREDRGIDMSLEQIDSYIAKYLQNDEK